MPPLLDDGVQLLLEGAQLPLDLGGILLGVEHGDAVLGEERGHQRVGIPDHGN